MPYKNYVPIIGMILNITRGDDCCRQMMSLRTDSGIVNFRVDTDTLVIDSRQLLPGMRVAAFYDSTLPVPLIFPPQYAAKIVTVLDRNEQVMLNYFDGNLLSEDGALQLNLERNTNIRTTNGQNFTCRLGNQTLLVYYTVTTRSIPPQTTPRRVVVFC